MNPGEPQNPDPAGAHAANPTEHLATGAAPVPQSQPPRFAPGQPQTFAGTGGFSAQPGPGWGDTGFVPIPPGGPNTGYWGPQQPIQRPLPEPAVLLALASVIAGIVTYFMGFASWVVLLDEDDIEDKAHDWSHDVLNGNTGLPAFVSPDLILNPAKFLILLGVVAVATTLVLIPRYRKFLPLLAVFAAAGWLALIAAALALPPVVELGAGAIVALVFGALQFALLLGAAFVHGRKPEVVGTPA